MRKLSLILLILSLLTSLQAQNITTMWTYKYSDFNNGTVFFNNNTTLVAPLNVHLLKSTLHYLNNDQVKEVNTTEITRVQINNDSYYMRNNQLMKFVSGDSVYFVAELLLADFSSINESGGAYGSSSNVQATRKLSSLEIGGINVTNHMELKSNKDGGALLPLITKYFIVTPETVFPATKKGIESQLPDERKNEFKQFIKNNKVSWKRPETFSVLLNFFKK